MPAHARWAKADPAAFASTRTRDRSTAGGRAAVAMHTEESAHRGEHHLA